MLIVFLTCYFIAAVFTYLLCEVFKQSKVLSFVFAVIWPIMMVIFMVDAIIDSQNDKK